MGAFGRSLWPAALCVVAILGIAVKLREGPLPPSSESAPRDESATAARPSTDAWSGRILATSHWLAPPEGHVATDACALLRRTVWCPDAATCDAIVDTTWSSGSARAALRQGRTCEPSGCWVHVPAPRLTELTRAARGALSDRLSAWHQNPFDVMPLVRVGDDPSFAETPGLAPEARDALRALAWGDGDLDAISHPSALCELGLGTESLRDALRAVWTRRATEFSVVIPSPGDVARVARYWSWGRDAETLRLRLEAAWWAGRRRIDAAELLPQGVGRRINTFGPAADDAHNCLHAALCVDEAECPARLMNDDAERRVARGFERAAGPDALRAGDVVLWRRADGTILHAAAWLAEDLLFTKNGSSHLSPWLVTSMDRVRRTYRTAAAVEYWRRKSLPVGAVPP